MQLESRPTSRDSRRRFGLSYTRPSLQIQHFYTTSFVLRDYDFLCSTYILAFGGHLPLFLTTVSLRMRRNCYFRAFGQNSDIGIRFSDPDCLKESNNLAIGRCFQVFYRTDRKSAIFVFPVYLTYLNMC